jgi:hypothetical protein
MCREVSEGLAAESGLVVARTHNLEDLLTQILPRHASLKSLRRGMGFLTDFAMETRYPGKTTSKRQAAAALRWADKVRTAARALLGIRARPTRR